jgi:hypothetical protein
LLLYPQRPFRYISKMRNRKKKKMKKNMNMTNQQLRDTERERQRERERERGKIRCDIRGKVSKTRVDKSVSGLSLILRDFF